jgi:hypothetical protein
MAVVLARRPSAFAAIGLGCGRLWARGAFAVFATWAIVALVSLVVVAPAWAWWSGALGHTIDGARLLGSPSVSTLAELVRESPFGFRTIALAALAGAALAVLLNPFLAGGLIGALIREPRGDGTGAVDGDGRGARFAADGVRRYGPLLRVPLIIWPIIGIGGGVFAGVAGALVGATTAPAVGLATGGLILFGATIAATILVDLARIHVVRAEVPRAGAAVVASLTFLGRQGVRVPALALAFAIAFALAAAALLAGRGWLSGETWPSILAGVVVQQAYALGRTWLRASLLASELVLVEADAERRAQAAALAAAEALPVETVAASVAAAEERPEMLVVVEGEAGEGGLVGDEGRRGADLPPEIPGRLAAEGDRGRGDAEALEAGPAAPVLAGDRPGDEPPPVA